MPGRTILLRTIDEVIGMYMMLMRIEGGVPIDRICLRLNITPEQLRQYERGEIPVPASKLYLFADLMNIKVDFFFTDLIQRLRKSGEALG